MSRIIQVNAPAIIGTSRRLVSRREYRQYLEYQEERRRCRRIGMAVPSRPMAMSPWVSTGRFSSGPTSPDPIAVLGGDLLAWYQRGTGIYNSIVGGSPVSSDGDQIGRWEDQSGNGYHLTRARAMGSHYLQWRPGTTHLGVGTIQNYDATVLDPEGFAVPDALMSALGTAGEGEIWCCWKARHVTAEDGLWRFGTSGSQNNHYEWSDGHVYDGWGSNARKDTGNLNASFDIASAFHVYNVYSKTNDWQSFLNNVSFYSTGSNTVAFVSSGATLLASESGGYYWRGFISECVIANKKVTTGKRDGIYTYLTV